MEKALHSEKDAEEVFSFLGDLTLDTLEEQSPFASRAFCLVNMERIRDKYPEKFSAKFESIKSKTPARILTLAEAFNN